MPRPLVPPNIEHLSPYVPGGDPEQIRQQFQLDTVYKLASNENPLGPSPLALQAIVDTLQNLHLYPNPARGLREVLAERFRVSPDNVITGAGSESIMANIIRTFLCDDDEVLTAEPTFPGFRVLAQSRGVAYRAVPARSDWRFDLEALAAAITPRTKIIYLANPNNPTGLYFPRDKFDAFYRHIPPNVLLILDEAYYEYACHRPDFPDSLQYRYDNVITLRTFSKAYGLAGVRVGYGLAHADLIRNLLKVKLPFEPSSLAQAAGKAALSDEDFLRRSLDHNRTAMRFLTESLRELGFDVVPSHANFIQVVLSSAAEAEALTDDLLRQGVILRHLTSFGLPHCVRISAGTPEANRRCVECMAHFARSYSL